MTYCPVPRDFILQRKRVTTEVLGIDPRFTDQRHPACSGNLVREEQQQRRRHPVSFWKNYPESTKVLLMR
jgi:hypothetical protein